MTLNLLDLYNECASQPWSMYDTDIDDINDIETALKISINKAISYLWNYQPWSFRYKTYNLTLRNNKTDYSLPNGLIMKKAINGTTKYCLTYGKKYLDYAEDYEAKEDKIGEPEYFYIEGEKLYIYPTPDKEYSIKVKYLLLPYGLNEDGDYINELNEETDYINIPEKYEIMFKNCLISLAMLYAIADESDENYSGYLNQYNNALKVLTEYCNDRINDRSVIW